MNAQEEFRDLIHKARQGCQQSIRVLVEQYRDHVLRVIRRNLHRRVRSKLDSIDIEQLVWQALFCGNGELKEFDGPKHFRAWLEQVAAHHARKANRHYLGMEKASVFRECQLEAAEDRLVTGNVEVRATGACGIDDDEWEECLAHLPRQTQRTLTMIRAGSSLRDIALLLGVSERTIGRMLARLRHQTASFLSA